MAAMLMMTVGCMTLFGLIYGVGYFALFRKWRGKGRFGAASCTMSLVHGTITTILSAYDLLQYYYYYNPSPSAASASDDAQLQNPWPWQLDAPNTPLQTALMTFSTSYFYVDLLHYLIFDPLELPFILHHLVACLYMLSCNLFTRHGAISVMALMCLGEITGPLQCIWSISRHGRHVSSHADRVYRCISWPYTLFFTLCRGIVGPLLMWKLCAFYLLSDQADHRVIPFWLASAWMMMAVMGIAGSMVWITSLWAILRATDNAATCKGD